MSPPRPKNGLYLKRCGVVYDISNRQSFSPTAKVCDCTTGLFGKNTVISRGDKLIDCTLFDKSTKIGTEVV